MSLLVCPSIPTNKQRLTSHSVLNPTRVIRSATTREQKSNNRRIIGLWAEVQLTVDQCNSDIQFKSCRVDLELRVGWRRAVALHVDEPGGRGPLSHPQPIPELLRQDTRLCILDLLDNITAVIISELLCKAQELQHVTAHRCMSRVGHNRCQACFSPLLSPPTEDPETRTLAVEVAKLHHRLQKILKPGPWLLR